MQHVIRQRTKLQKINNAIFAIAEKDSHDEGNTNSTLVKQQTCGENGGYSRFKACVATESNDESIIEMQPIQPKFNDWREVF